MKAESNPERNMNVLLTLSVVHSKHIGVEKEENNQIFRGPQAI